MISSRVESLGFGLCFETYIGYTQGWAMGYASRHTWYVLNAGLWAMLQDISGMYSMLGYGLYFEEERFIYSFKRGYWDRYSSRGVNDFKAE